MPLEFGYTFSQTPPTTCFLIPNYNDPYDQTFHRDPMIRPFYGTKEGGMYLQVTLKQYTHTHVITARHQSSCDHSETLGTRGVLRLSEGRTSGVASPMCPLHRRHASTFCTLGWSRNDRGRASANSWYRPMKIISVTSNWPEGDPASRATVYAVSATTSSEYSVGYTSSGVVSLSALKFCCFFCRPRPTSAPLQSMKVTGAMKSRLKMWRSVTGASETQSWKGVPSG